MDERQPNRHERRKQRTRQLLQQTTRQLLVQKGYDALTVQDITDTADLGRGTFYIHFDDKEDAVWSLLVVSFQALDATLRTQPAASPAVARYRKWQRLFQYVDENRALLAVLIGERGHITLYRRTAEYMARIIERDMRDGTIDRITDHPVDIVSQFFAGAMMQVIMHWLQHPDAYTVDQLAAIYYELTLRQPPPSPSN